jgi:hypothetical protein
MMKGTWMMICLRPFVGLRKALVGGMILAALVVQAAQAQDEAEAEASAQPLPAIGYTDTPIIPGTPWRVHDINRPRPRIVTVAPAGPVQPPPADAIVLFDGSDLSHWRKADQAGDLFPAGWKSENGYLEVVPNSGSIQTVDTFGDCQLHIEWSAPSPPEGNSQGRGNSGVIIMGRYEVQVLDSYNNVTYADGQAASVYGQYPPLVNVTRPPGEWNVYDIVFEAPRFENNKLSRPGYVTVIHNGVLVQYHREIRGAVAHKHLAEYEPHSPAGPLVLQDHGNPTRFRNIWVRPLGLED